MLPKKWRRKQVEQSRGRSQAERQGHALSHGDSGWAFVHTCLDPTPDVDLVGCGSLLEVATLQLKPSLQD